MANVTANTSARHAQPSAKSNYAQLTCQQTTPKHGSDISETMRSGVYLLAGVRQHAVDACKQQLQLHGRQVGVAAQPGGKQALACACKRSRWPIQIGKVRKARKYLPDSRYSRAAWTGKPNGIPRVVRCTRSARDTTHKTHKRAATHRRPGRLPGPKTRWPQARPPPAGRTPAAPAAAAAASRRRRGAASPLACQKPGGAQQRGRLRMTA